MLRQAIQGISDLILVPGLINLDFADVKTIMSGMGLAMMGTGIAEGEDRAVEAARRAISSPLLEGASVNGARGVIINVTGGPDLSLIEVSDASTIVQEAADEDANIIFGAVVDPALKGKVKITVIATGFGPFELDAPPGRARRHPVDMTPVRRSRPAARRAAADRRVADARGSARGCRSRAGRCSICRWLRRSARSAVGTRRACESATASGRRRGWTLDPLSTSRPSCAGRKADRLGERPAALASGDRVGRSTAAANADA